MSETRDVLAFPTKRKRAVKNPAGWWREGLPGNVQPIRPPVAPPQGELLPLTGYVALAIVQALRTNPKTWEHTGGPDVLGALQDMARRWSSDPEVLGMVTNAYSLVLNGRKSGRYHPY